MELKTQSSLPTLADATILLRTYISEGPSPPEMSWVQRLDTRTSFVLYTVHYKVGDLTHDMHEVSGGQQLLSVWAISISVEYVAKVNKGGRFILCHFAPFLEVSSLMVYFNHYGSQATRGTAINQLRISMSSVLPSIDSSPHVSICLGEIGSDALYTA